jgi:hypothetical protein
MGRKLATLGMIGLGLLAAGKAKADLNISTNPEGLVWARGGDYSLKVNADSREGDVSGKSFYSAEWDLVVPTDYFSVNGASLPSADNPSTNPNDWYYGFSMNSGWNRVDSTLTGNELTDNVRMTQALEGPSNREGELGVYDIHVRDDAPLGQTSFDLNGVYFSDTDFNEYAFSGGNLGILNVPITIAEAGDANLDGVVNGTDLSILSANFGLADMGWTGADFDNDGISNGTDLSIMSGNFGDGVTSSVPEPATIGLLGLGGLGLLVAKGRRREDF